MTARIFRTPVILFALGILWLAPLATRAQTVTYYFANMAFDDGTRVTGYLVFDTELEQVTDLEMFFWETATPGPPQQIFFPAEATVESPFYHDYFTDEPYLDVYTEDFIDFQSDTLLQLGAPSAYINFQLGDSLLSGAQTIGLDLVDGTSQGSYQTANTPAFLWPFAGIAYQPIINWDRSFSSGFLTQDATLAAVPEPASVPMLIGSIAAVMVFTRRRRRSSLLLGQPGV